MTLRAILLHASILMGGLLCGACQSEVQQPTEQPENTTRSQEEELRQFADTLGIPDPPEVEVVREVSPSESSAVHNACLVEDGWVQNDDKSFSFTDEQEPALNLSEYMCAAAYPIADYYLQPMQPEQWEMVYDHYVEDFIPCARRHGFDTSEPPTRERFLAFPESWAPVADIERELTEGIGRGEFESFEDFYETCPSTPTDDELYGAP